MTHLLKSQVKNLPKKLRIGHREYLVFDYRDQSHVTEDEEYGHTDNRKQAIRIFENYAPASEKHYQDWNTVIHEFFHSAWCSYGIRDEGLKDKDALRQEEKFVNMFANMVCELFMRNPDFLRYTNETFKKKRAS